MARFPFLIFVLTGYISYFQMKVNNVDPHQTKESEPVQDSEVGAIMDKAFPPGIF